MKTWDGSHHKNYGKGGDSGVDYCVRCGRRIRDDEETVSLELNSATGEYAEMNPRVSSANEYSNFGADSQGWFPFGKTCAARTMEEQRQRRLAEMKSRRSA